MENNNKKILKSKQKEISEMQTFISAFLNFKQEEMSELYYSIKAQELYIVADLLKNFKNTILKNYHNSAYIDMQTDFSFFNIITGYVYLKMLAKKIITRI